MTPTHILVKAARAGLLVPIHKDDGLEPSGAQLRVTSDVVVRVRYSQSIRRAISEGHGRRDLVMCDMNGNAVDSAELAAAPDELPGGKISLKDTP